MVQDKSKEIIFFDQFSEQGQYNVFENESNLKLIQTCIDFGGFQSGSLIADLGCGSGVFTNLLQKKGVTCLGMDISYHLIAKGSKFYPNISFTTGDVEFIPFASESLDGILLSGIIHHLPDPSILASEVFRVLKPGGVVIGFDPNRFNPFMWLYRVKSSPFYSNKGVTENEQPINATQVMQSFKKVGFDVYISYLSGLKYRYVASKPAQLILPIYNLIDDALSRIIFLKPYSAFVLTKGVKK